MFIFGLYRTTVWLSIVLIKKECIFRTLVLHFNFQYDIMNKTRRNGGIICMNYGKISLKQQEILDYIKSEIINKGYPPAVREICEAVKLKSTSSVHSHLETLEKNGYIRRDPTKPRAIEIMDDNFNLTRRELVNVPIVGTVTAGQPILAVENIEGYFPMPTEYMPNEETFMLKVKGESMINVGIFNGDKILVKKQPNADNGDIVVALIDDSVTVKTYYKEKGYYRLQPENDTMDPIIVQELNILGKVIGLFRMYQ
jgi:repressor LexA